MREPLEATLRRLKEEREDADRRYNEALTALDHAKKPPPDLPGLPAAYDEQQIAPLNESWNILPAPPEATGLKGRLTGFIWRTVAPFFQRQLAFNSRLVDHLNRNVAPHRDARLATAAALGVFRDHLSREAEMHSRLMYLLQQITAYVDTKDRDTAGGVLVLNASLSALAESMARRAESAAVKIQHLERQFDARTTALEQTQQDLRTSAAVSQQALAAFKRELERSAVSGAATAPQDASGCRAPAAAEDAFGSRLDAYKYVGFEDRFRGSQEMISARLETYLPFFDAAADVLDVGCGRGEFLVLLGSRGIAARGIDVNPEMVELCRARGLDVSHADAAGYLATVDDESVGGIFAAQVVEHLEPAYLIRFLELAFRKLSPRGRLVLETLNPACWVAFFESYIRDITHVRPLHPETLKYLVLASGFPVATLEYRSPVPDEDRLQPAAAAEGAGLDDLVEIFNANADKLNARLFTFMDYAVVAEKTTEHIGMPPRE